MTLGRRGGRDRRPFEGTNAVLAVNGVARGALASLAGRLRPLTAALRRGALRSGNLAPINKDHAHELPRSNITDHRSAESPR